MNDIKQFWLKFEKSCGPIEYRKVSKQLIEVSDPCISSVDNRCSSPTHCVLCETSGIRVALFLAY